MTDKAVDKPKMGRPTTYNQVLGDEICARLAEGRSMNSVCEDNDMPHAGQVYRWMSMFPDFRDKYYACVEVRATALSELMVHEAINSNDVEVVTVRETEKGILRETKYMDNVQRSDSIIRTLQWQLARMAPKRFGEKVELNGKVDITKHYGDDDLDILNRHIEQKAAELIQTRNKEKNNGDQIDEP